MLKKHNIRYWRRQYKEAIKREDYDYIDQVIMCEIWSLKWVNNAYIKYAKDCGYKDPLLADEQYGLSNSWAHTYLFEGR